MSAPGLYFSDSDNTDSDRGSCSSSPATDSSPFALFSSSLPGLSGSPTSSVSSLSSLSPSSPYTSSLPTPPRTPSKAKSAKIKAGTKKSTPRRPRSPDHIPRPRNAFMIYRSAFYENKVMTPDVERDHRIISRVIGMCWRQLNHDEKRQWFEKAAEEKEQHKAKYPGYRFRPQYGGEPKQKRNVKRNGAKELKRCAALADAILKGGDRDEIQKIAQTYDDMPEEELADAYTTTVFDSRPSDVATPPFKNPFSSPVMEPSFLEPQPSASGLQLTNMGSGAGCHSSDDISLLLINHAQDLASHGLGVQQPLAGPSTAAWGMQLGSQPLSSSAPAFTSPLDAAAYCPPGYSASLSADRANGGSWAVPSSSFPYATEPVPMPSISSYAASMGRSEAGFHWATTTESLHQVAPSQSLPAHLQGAVNSALFSQW
ncbi:specific transcriptional repressor-like protein [Phanerochaete sordida]|uniref:Specific transcriptional repressor-like protein n=1 Tax=Phanerochaete sordida TaxID=48140 RepID=A0A9P3LBC6_9APHY|nr:specific transcriptional repressor-like protein [Phanerochaete sordida]